MVKRSRLKRKPKVRIAKGLGRNLRLQVVLVSKDKKEAKRLSHKEMRDLSISVAKHVEKKGYSGNIVFD